MANTEKNLVSPESEEAQEAAPETIERQMTPEEAEHEFEEMRDEILDEAIQQVETFHEGTTVAVDDAETKAGEKMSPDEKAALSAIDDKADATKDAFVTETRQDQELPSDEELAAQVMDSPYEQALREAEKANAELSPEELAARQKEFSEAVKDADNETDEDRARADLASMTDEDIEASIATIEPEETDIEAAKADLQEITDEDVENAIDAIRTDTDDIEAAKADLQEITDEDVENAIDAITDDSELARKALEGISDEEIKALVDTLEEEEPGITEKMGGMGKLLELAGAVAAIEAIKNIGELKERLQNSKEIKDAAEAARKERDQEGLDAKALAAKEAADKKKAELAKQVNATPAEKKKPSFSERLSKWFDKTFMEDSTATKIFKKIAGMFK